MQLGRGNRIHSGCWPRSGDRHAARPEVGPISYIPPAGEPEPDPPPMLVPLEPLVDVAREPVVELLLEPITGALGAMGALLGKVAPPIDGFARGTTLGAVA